MVLYVSIVARTPLEDSHVYVRTDITCPGTKSAALVSLVYSINCILKYVIVI